MVDNAESLKWSPVLTSVTVKLRHLRLKTTANRNHQSVERSDFRRSIQLLDILRAKLLEAAAEGNSLDVPGKYRS